LSKIHVSLNILVTRKWTSVLWSLAVAPVTCTILFFILYYLSSMQARHNIMGKNRIKKWNCYYLLTMLILTSWLWFTISSVQQVMKWDCQNVKSQLINAEWEVSCHPKLLGHQWWPSNCIFQTLLINISELHTLYLSMT
jgi:hypothetical protein